jgi:predicted ABC-type ATPase
MPDEFNRPVVLVFAGPNGSGKTTLKEGISVVGAYVNADDIKSEYGLSDIEAAEAAEALRNELLNKGADFSFETVLSTDRNLLLMRKAKAHGYVVKCLYILTCDENVNVLRVKTRYESGEGHDVNETEVRERYRRCMTLLPKVVEVCDSIIIYDNTDMPFKIFSKNGSHFEVCPNSYWSDPQIRNLVGM